MREEIMVSINCITYNQEAYISEAIESFLMQKTNFKYEILIHDDASTDNTPSIIKEYEEKYPHIIKPIYQKENKYSKGIKVAYEYNVKRAKGKYIAICEGDDYWIDPYKLQKQVDYMELNPRCTLCIHEVELIDAISKKSTGFIKPYNYSAKCCIEDMITRGGGFVGTNSLLFPRKIFGNPPEWYLNCPVGDYPMQLFLTYKGYAYYMNENMSAYRTNAKNSWTEQMCAAKVEKWVKLMDDINVMLDKFNNFSNKQYNTVICKTKKRNEFEKALVKVDLQTLKSHEFKEMYSNLDIQIKIKLLIKRRFPYYKKIVKLLRGKLQNE